MTTNSLNVAVLGAGLIGLDLVGKIQASPYLDCRLVVGRDPKTLGLRRAADLGCETSAGGVTALVGAGPFDVVFDATSAAAHTAHWAALSGAAPLLVDLTPSSLGIPVVPAVNGSDAPDCGHINLISCGGQASIPLLHAITRDIAATYIEVVTTVASPTVGRATRLNLDEYIATTQAAIRTFTGAEQAKVLVNISPAVPPPPFRVAMTVQAPGLEPARVHAALKNAERQAQAWCTPGFTITSCHVTDGQATVAAEVTATAGRLPAHAGNLHVINAAAVLLAEQRATGKAL
ncbi:acetaldehyde dehydrogenase (acetylating) [Streptomyces europaeiscabiei]|uniref:acetaldehyde dehydrogenase (acetylating) n=1 Tax=Streptomyces europaeiscabiei TaxID=146819 RepID=UPI0029B282BF|nr:acetaldehyde dehydrogenase (acetylating) [Streptomyces europaeiscabiei]MDX3697808.1 acetaldehyde dehydrogenase (acetylating) [Streptomyces europaeiscabiei]